MSCNASGTRNNVDFNLYPLFCIRELEAWRQKPGGGVMWYLFYQADSSVLIFEKF